MSLHTSLVDASALLVSESMALLFVFYGCFEDNIIEREIYEYILSFEGLILYNLSPKQFVFLRRNFRFVLRSDPVTQGSEAELKSEDLAGEKVYLKPILT